MNGRLLWTMLVAGLCLASPLVVQADANPSTGVGVPAVEPATPATKGPGVAAGDLVAAAIANPARPKEDIEQDARRHPAAILTFLGVAPGQHVLDAFAAGGYYTELLSRIVGPDGEVIAYNNPPYAGFAAKSIATRYASDRLPNVRQITSEVDQLELAPNSLDAALFIMSYHDMYWRPAEGGWEHTDPALMLSKLHAALKPGGVVVVEDHVANAGGDPQAVVDKLHRIDPAVVRRDFEKAGFVFDDESRELAHPNDDHMKLVFDPAIRGMTDQFIYRFRKPAK
jgi:predicted methyltransferase